MRLSPLVPALLLVACAPAPRESATTPLAGAAGQASPRSDPRADVARPARTASRRGEGTMARADGYGALRFGMDEAAVRASWRGPALRGGGPAPECHYLSPDGQAAPAALAFMLEGDRFVRYDVGQGNSAVTAPGGGRIGMDADTIRALYPRIETRPHKYLPGGSVLRLTLGNGAVLAFETDAAGTVGAWRVGLPPQADYVEGCA